MSATVRQIVDDATELIGEVAGAGVQAYSEDALLKHAVRSFNLLFKKFAWHQYVQWFHLELDGTTGTIDDANTEDFENVQDFEDFLMVCPDGTDRPLPILPSGINPYRLTSGTSPRYWTSLPVTNEDYETKKIVVYPLTTEGFIDVCARVYPITKDDNGNRNWTWDDVMHLDRDMLVAGTAYMALIGDETNNAAAEACKEMMEGKFRDIMQSLSDHPIPAGATSSSIPDRWTPA